MKTVTLTTSGNTISLSASINSATVTLIDIATVPFWLHPAQYIEGYEEVEP